MKHSSYRFFKMVKKEFRLIRTDPWNLVIALLLPPGIIILLSSMEQEKVTFSPLPVAIVSNDSNTYINPNNFTEIAVDNYTQPYIDAVIKSLYLFPKAIYNTSKFPYAMELARRQLLYSEIKCIIVIPVDFTEMLINGLPGLIKCIPDSSRITDIQSNLNAVYDSIKIFNDDNNLKPQVKLRAFTPFSIPENYNEGFNSTLVVVLPLMVFGIANVLTILIIVKEKPIPRLLLTPVKRKEILFAKFLTFSIILLFQELGIILAAIFGGLFVKGSIIGLFLAIYMIGYSGLSIGTFISSVSKTKTEANQLFLASFVIIILLSGSFVPIESMPIYLQVISYVLPLSHGGPMIKSILTKGVSVFGFHFYMLLGVSLILNILTFIVFYRRRYEV
jgi:ABC-2 type transport system permease protein